jgi:hypothetical protein
MTKFCQHDHGQCQTDLINVIFEIFIEIGFWRYMNGIRVLQAMDCCFNHFWTEVMTSNAYGLLCRPTKLLWQAVYHGMFPTSH